jgi:hypothetical protein
VVSFLLLPDKGGDVGEAAATQALSPTLSQREREKTIRVNKS